MTANPPGLQARHQQALDDGRFLIQRCAACQRHVYFPRVLCPHCGAPEPELVAPAGGGQVLAVTVISRRPELGGDYNVCMVGLDEGVQLMSQVQDLAAVQVGQRVRARVAQQGGHGRVVFDLEPSA